MHSYRQFLEECRDRIDARQLLEHYGAENIHENSDELIHSCVIDQIVPHHTNGDAAPSASLNKNSLLFNCFSYGGGDVIWLIQQLEGTSDKDYAVDVLSRFLGEAVDYSVEELKEKIQNYFLGEPADEAIPRYNPKVLDAWLAIHPYLIEDRGLSEKVLVRHRVGYDIQENSIVLPHFWLGRLAGWQKRKMDHPRWPQLPDVHSIPKYKNSPSFPRLQTVWNMPDTKRHSVVVVESVMSAMAIEGFREMDPEICPWPIATFGSKVTEMQSNYLRTFDEVVIFFDWDSAGWQGALKLVALLIDYTTVRVVIEPPENKDPGEMTMGELKVAMLHTVPGIMAIPYLKELVHKWRTKQQKVRVGQ